MKLKISFGLFLVFSLFLFIFNHPSYGAKNSGFYYEAGPMLFYPVTQNIDLKGKDYLEFKWWRVELIWTDRFIFKLYKGYNTIASNLILKQEAAPFDYPIRMPASQFEVNQVYTWVLQQVFNGGRKSDKSFSSFKIIKK